MLIIVFGLEQFSLLFGTEDGDIQVEADKHKPPSIVYFYALSAINVSYY